MASYRTVTVDATLSDNTVQAEGTVSDGIARVTAVSQSVRTVAASDYAYLTNKPEINSHTLEGDQSSADLGLAPAEHTHTGTVSIPGTSVVESQTVTTPSGPQTLYSNYKPKGSVTVNAYTPEGTVSAPTVDVEMRYVYINSITDVGTLPTWNASVTGEVLSFAFNEGTLPTKSETKMVVTSATATASAPTFTGTAKAPTASFSGTSATNLTTVPRTVSVEVS